MLCYERYIYTMEITLGSTLAAHSRVLADAGVDSPRLSAQLLAGHVLGLDRLHVELASERVLADDEVSRIQALVARRAQGEPLAHLLGRREFYGRDFVVNAHTLIPRPDTEILIDTVLRLTPATACTFADLGAGSGCIGVTLACERSEWQGLLLELDARAAATAQANAARLGVAGRMRCVRGDMFHAPIRQRACDLVVANPPYIAREETPDVMDEVLRFEPHTALFSEQQGLAHLAACVATAAHLLRPGGHVVLEHGYRQGQAVRGLLADAGFAQAATECDLAGHERCTWAQK